MSQDQGSGGRIRGDRGERARVVMAAGALIADGRVLLGLRHPDRSSFPSVWDVPGGHVEPGESVEQGLVRELHEELGVEVTVGAPWRRLVDDELGGELVLWRVRHWHGEVRNRSPHEPRREPAGDAGASPAGPCRVLGQKSSASRISAFEP